MASELSGGGLIPPPPGVEPNLIDPPSQTPNNIALHTICLALVTVFVVIRLYTRICITKAKLWIDDFLCVISYCLSVTYSALMCKTFTLGIGRHMWDEPVAWLIPAMKYFTMATFVYIGLTGFIKLTFLFFYYRIFATSRKVKMIIMGGIIFVACLNTALFFAVVFECKPIARAWDASLPGHCMDGTPGVLPWFSGATSSATDIFVLILPLPLLWGLNMSLAMKLRLLAVFSLGLFACIASLVRLGKTNVLYVSHDATWNVSLIGIWATIEINVAIMCSCMVVMPAFLEHHLSSSFRASIRDFWSRTIRGVSLRNTPKEGSGSPSDQKDWSDYKQGHRSESQHNIVKHTDIVMQTVPSKPYIYQTGSDSWVQDDVEAQRPERPSMTGGVPWEQPYYTR